MDKNELISARAEEAKFILSSKVWNESWSSVRTAILETWAALDRTDDRHSKHSEDLHRMIKCLDKVKHVVETHVENGKIQAKALEKASRLPWRA